MRFIDTISSKSVVLGTPSGTSQVASPMPYPLRPPTPVDTELVELLGIWKISVFLLSVDGLQ
jgi:hypothetical protein